jgi:COP9 signalosome complex subunit 7
MAKSARILTYSSLQEGLDIASIRELEDLIIEAMYQDVIHGKLDQLRQIFEIEWAMGRDLRQGEEKELLDALKNWSKTTGQVLKALDQQIKSIKEKERAHTKMLEDQEKEFQANLQEAAIKAKEQPASSSQGHARQARRPLGPAGQGSRGDDMDIDEIVERGGMGGAFDMLRGKKKYVRRSFCLFTLSDALFF